MDYVSTRGDVSPLGFTEAMLAGLAPNGGLYVPAAWPRLEREAIAGFAGRPYAEVAVEVMRPFTAGSIGDVDLARMAREAYGSFRHPAVAPLTQIGANTFLLELFHGPTLAFKDLALQLLARLMDHALAAHDERRTVVVATSGDTGGAAIEAFAGKGRIDVVVLFPKGRVSEVQRRMMTTAKPANIHAIAIEGTFDDCQAIVKGMFNHAVFRDRVNLSGVNSINWARIVAQAVYYFTAAVALGAPHRAVAFTVPTGNFGDVYAGYVAQLLGLPIERLTIATNVNDILARVLATGSYELRDVVPTSSPSMDIQVASNFERLLFEAYGRDSGAVRTLMDSLAKTRRFTLSAHALVANSRLVYRRTRGREGSRRHYPHSQAGDWDHRRSAYRGWHRGSREGAAQSVGADGGTFDRASGKISRCGRGGLRRATSIAGMAFRSQSTAGASHCAAGGSICGRAFRSDDKPCRARRSGGMSVAATKLKSGINVVTDTMPHLETASLGVWVNSGSRDERHDEHGISHFLEHMAFKGTRRRSARQIAEEIEAVGGDLNAATSIESTAYFARVLKADVPLAIDVLADILSEPAFAHDDLTLEQNVIVQEIGAVADTPDDLIFEYLQATAFPEQPFGRSILGTPATVRSFDGAKLRDYLGRHYRGPDMVIAAAGAVNHEAVVAEVEKRFASFNGPASPAPEPARFGGGAHVEKRKLEQVHIALALPGLAQDDPQLYSLQMFSNVLGGGMSSRLFPGSAREARPVLLDPLLSRLILGCRHVRTLFRHRCRRRFRTDAPRGR